MTVAAATPMIDYEGTGTAAALPVPFAFLTSSALRVVAFGAGADEILVEGTHYSVTGAGQPAGGEIVPLLPIAHGMTWRIERDTLIEQPTEYAHGGAFPAKSHERALDRQAMIAQELNARSDDLLSRSLMLPRGEAGSVLPSAVMRAGQWLGFDAQGRPALADSTALAVVLSAPVQQMVQPMVDAAASSARFASHAVAGVGAMGNYRVTLVAGVADFAVGQYFTSTAVTAENPGGAMRSYLRIAAAPGYQDLGWGAAPASAADLARLSTPNIDALLARDDLSYGPIQVGDVVSTQGEGFAYQVLAASATDHDLTTAGGLKLRVLPGPNGLDGRAFGMKIDDVTDDAAALTKVAAACVARNLPLYVPRTDLNTGCYLASAVNLRFVGEIDFRAPIRVDPAIEGIPIRMGGLYNSSGKMWRIPTITDGTGDFEAVPSRPLLEISGLVASKIQMGAQRFVRLSADTGYNSTDGATAYNRFDLDGVFGLIELTGLGGGWVNENVFFGGRILRLYILKKLGNYHHNNNIFRNATFEGAMVHIKIDGSSNRVEGARFEGTASAPGIELLEGSDNNVITSSWSSSLDPTDHFYRPGIPIVDNGMGNAVFRPQQYEWREIPLVEISARSAIVASATDSGAPNSYIGAAGRDAGGARLVPGLATVGVPPWEHIFTTDLIPVSKGDVVTWRADFDGAKIRTKIYAYDENQQLLSSEGGGGAFINQVGTAFTSGLYVQSTNIDAVSIAPASIARAEVKYIVVAAWFGEGGSIRQISASLRVARGGTTDGMLTQSVVNNMPSVTGDPVAGFLPRGFAVHDTASNALRRVIFAHETSVVGAVVAGATSVGVAAAGGIADGDLFGVLLDNQETHWSSISDVSGTTFTIAPVPAGRTVGHGARAVFNRWA